MSDPDELTDWWPPPWPVFVVILFGAIGFGIFLRKHFIEHVGCVEAISQIPEHPTSIHDLCGTTSTPEIHDSYVLCACADAGR
jgi:hypothetical protein